MSTPYRFTPRVPAPPYPTPASASAYILPNPKALKPPIHNPYEKFTQPQFDAWIGEITGALRRALGQEDEEAPTTKKEQGAQGDVAAENPRYKPVETEDSDDEPIDDSFAVLKARRAGKGKARDPREGPGLGKGDSTQPIQIVSSDEEEEEEVELSIAQLDDEESDEEEEEYSAEEEYAWERGQSSSQPLPSPERTRRRITVQEEEYEDEEEEEEEEEIQEEEADFDEYDEEEYDEEGEEEHGQARGSSPQVIELISDDEEEIQPPSISKRPGKERHHENEEELEGEEEYGSDEYAEYDEEDQEAKKIVSPRTKRSALRDSDPSSGHRADREVMDVDEQDEIFVDDAEVEPIELVGVDSSLPPKWRRSLDIRQNQVEIPDPWKGPRTYAEDFYAGGDIRQSPSKQKDASHLGPEDDDLIEEIVDDEIQPKSQDTSFPPETALPPTVTQDQSDIEIPDPWSGPRHYAQDFYSAGPIVVLPGATPNADRLRPEDTQHIDIVDVDEGILEEEIDEEIEEEIQPLNADDSFPPREGSEGNLPNIQDPWEGPEIYAEDFYSGGDVRTLPGEPIDPSLLTGTGDLDDGIDAFLTPGALSPSQSERISIANEEFVDEDARAQAQHYVTASRRDQPIPADAEFISIDDSDDEQETKLQDTHPVSEEADYSGIYDFDGTLQETEENVDDQNIIAPPFDALNQGQTITVEYDDRFEQVGHAQQQIFYVEENEDNLDILTSAEAQNGLLSDFGDISSSTFLSEMSSSNFAIPSHVAIDDAEPSQEIIHPAEVVELGVDQEEIMIDVGEATSEHIIDLDTQVEGATISEINAAVVAVSSEGAENTPTQDQVIVEEVRDISVSANEKVVLVEEITNIDEGSAEKIPTDDVEVQNVNPEGKEIWVDVELEATEPFAGVGRGTDKKELIPDIQDAEETPIDFIPSSPSVLAQAESIIEAIQEEILDDSTPHISTVQPPVEAHISEGVQETPINSTPSASDSTSHRKVQIEGVLDEDAPTEAPKNLESMDAAEDYYADLEAVVEEFTDEDADGDVDLEIEIVSAATASLIRERLVYEKEEYLIEEPITEGRLTEEPSDRATSLGVVSVGPDEVAAVSPPVEDPEEFVVHVSSDETATEATHVKDHTATLEETINAIDRGPAVEVSNEATVIQEEISLQETSKGESITASEIGHIEKLQDTTEFVAEEAIPHANVAEVLEAVIKPEVSNLSNRASSPVEPSNDLLSSEGIKESTEASVSITIPLTPSLVRTIREQTLSPTTPRKQLEPTTGTSPLTSGEMRDQVMSSISRAFFGPTLPNYFGELNVDFTSAALPPLDRDGTTTSSATVPTTVPTSVPATTSVTVAEVVAEIIPTTVPETIISEAVPEIALPATVPAVVPTTILTTGQETDPATVSGTAAPIISPTLRAILPPAIRAFIPIAPSSTVPPPPPMGVSLTRPRVPVLMSDPYPYSLSTPHDSFAYLFPEEGSEEENGLDNSLSSISTVEQEKDKKGSAGALDDGEDLEFQYPPEQEVIEELKKAGLPLSFLQPSKGESDTLATGVSASPTQLDESRVTTPTTNTTSEVQREESQQAKPLNVEAAIPPSNSKAADNLNTTNLPSTSPAESRPKIPTIKIPGSSKRSHKRKRDASPIPGSGQASHTEPPVGQKGKTKKASRSERKAKAQELKALVPEPTSEETIRVRPRPKGVTEQPSEPEKPTEGALPPFRLLQRGDRASSTVSSTPSDISAGAQQPSPTVNKPNKPPSQSQPQASLFHAHGRGRKILLPSIPPKMVKQIRAGKPSVSPAPSSSRNEPSVPTPPSVVHVPAAALVSDVVVPPTTSNNTATTSPSVPASKATPVTTPTPIAPVETSPVPVTPLATSPAVNPPTPSVHPTPVPPASAMNTPTHHATPRARPSRVASITSSPVTRSHCKYHRISLPKEEGGPRVCFLVPGCSLNDTELMEEEEIEDHGDATVEDSYRMIKDLDSLGFHSDLIGILRQLVGLDILREQEVFYLPAPGEEVFLRKNSLKKSASERSAMVRVPAESSTHVGSPGYSGGFAASPSSWKTATPVAGSNSPSITGRRSFIDSEKGSSVGPTDTERDISDGEEPQTKRVRPSPPEDHKSMGPPLPVQPKLKPIRIRKPQVQAKPEGEATGGTEADTRKSRKLTTKRGVKRSRTSEAVISAEGEPSPKKLKAHATAPGQLSPEKPSPSS